MTATIRARSSTSAELPVSGLWVIAVSGGETGDEPVVTVTLPGGGTAAPEVTADGYGCYRAEYVVASPGRHIARVVTASHGAVDFTAFVTGAVAAAAMPTITDVGNYLEEHSWSDDQLQDALDAEAAAQRRVCDVPAAYPPDMRQALLRRCWRNLKMRGQPLLTVPGGGENAADAIAPQNDPEVRRLERPFRKLAAL